MTTRMAITATAFEAIRESLPTGGRRPAQEVGDLYLVSVPTDTMDKLAALRRPGESYSDVIIRLAAGGMIVAPRASRGKSDDAPCPPAGGQG
jgi:hypothetical protein